MNMLFGSEVFVRNCMVTDNCCNKPTYFGYEVKRKSIHFFLMNLSYHKVDLWNAPKRYALHSVWIFWQMVVFPPCLMLFLSHFSAGQTCFTLGKVANFMFIWYFTYVFWSHFRRRFGGWGGWTQPAAAPSFCILYFVHLFQMKVLENSSVLINIVISS